MSDIKCSEKRKFTSFEFGIREKTILSLSIFVVFFIVKKEKIMDYSSTYGKVNFHRYLGNAI